jgi:hypothetical protein
VKYIDPVLALGLEARTGSKLIHLTLSTDLFVRDVISNPPLQFVLPTGLDFKSSLFDPDVKSRRPVLIDIVGFEILHLGVE